LRYSAPRYPKIFVGRGGEILSRRDEISNVLEKLEEYAAAGVRYIWVVDPRRKKAFAYDGALREVTSAFATTEEPLVELPLADAFLGLQRYFGRTFTV
jgi:Uma2 family endonuclease